MRPVMKPKLVAFTSSERLASVDGDGAPSLSSRLTALVDTLPFVGSRNSVRAYHGFDVIVSSGNPLLAALVLRGAAQKGLSAAIALGDGDDTWPYDLAATDEVAHVLATALGIEIPDGGSESRMEKLLTRVLADIPRTYPVISHELRAGSRPAGDEGVFFLGEQAPIIRPVDPRQLRLWSLFGRFMAGRTAVGACPRGRTVIFTRHAILTARPKHLAESRVQAGIVSWPPSITGYGSARWDMPTHPDAAKCMLEDLLTLARGLP